MKRPAISKLLLQWHSTGFRGEPQDLIAYAAERAMRRSREVPVAKLADAALPATKLGGRGGPGSARVPVNQ